MIENFVFLEGKKKKSKVRTYFPLLFCYLINQTDPIPKNQFKLIAKIDKAAKYLVNSPNCHTDLK